MKLIKRTPGRPKKQSLDRMLKVAVSDNDIILLDKTAEKLKVSKSEIVRKLVKTISSKDFENSLSDTSLELLYSYSVNAWELLHEDNCIFEVKDISNKMPVFVMTSMENPCVYVKYPTYKIQVLNNGMNSNISTIEEADITELLLSYKNKIAIYTTKLSHFIIDSSKIFDGYVCEIMCLDNSLANNINLKNSIISLLKKEKYAYNIENAYCIKRAPIIILDNGKYFKTIKSGDNND